MGDPLTTTETRREVMTWDDLGVGARAIAESAFADAYVPDVLLAVSRGGLLAAGAVAYAIGVKSTFTLNVELYTGIDERLAAPVLLPPIPDIVDLRSARVLVVDDVADTGATLELVKRLCDGVTAETRCAVLYEKPRSTVRCEYVWRRTEAWITFPWSAEPPVGTDGRLHAG